ncbi:MAG: hypothetical protein U9Q15_04630 [Patescibacteria group bacterium]|nr:hypothetical protein [Patescibacteria group bacterium]
MSKKSTLKKKILGETLAGLLSQYAQIKKGTDKAQSLVDMVAAQLQEKDSLEASLVVYYSTSPNTRDGLHTSVKQSLLDTIESLDLYSTLKTMYMRLICIKKEMNGSGSLEQHVRKILLTTFLRDIQISDFPKDTPLYKHYEDIRQQSVVQNEENNAQFTTNTEALAS